MAGRFERTARFSICAILVVAVSVEIAIGEVVRGASKELKIQFQVQGGADWCDSRVKIRLTASSATAFQPETIPFLRMIGRIRAVVLVQCPTIEDIIFDGAVSGRVVFAAETSRLTKWRRFISLDSKTRRPECPPAVAVAMCNAQIDAYMTAQKLMRGRAFDETDWTSVLEPEANDLAFKAKGVVGKLRIVSRTDPDNSFSTAAQFASAIIADIRVGCPPVADAAGAVVATDFGFDLAQRDLVCRAPNQLAARNVILVWASKDKFQVFSLWAEDPTLEEATRFADQLVEAIRRLR